MSIHLTPPQTSALPSDLRNNIYSALLSSGGIRSIEATLTQLLQTSGFQASLRAYITELFRTGQATTANEAYALAMERVRACMLDSDEANGTNGDANGDDEGDTVDLRLPKDVVRDGSRCVRRELEKVVHIDME
ncbi:hypothetical protein N0V95_009827 [Ascochyta clinopodiicola]|nr:hypothetical protein N0V95_009827 [Ascochyta clinopodiicola]